MKKETRYIMGKNCILELLRYDPSRMVELYTSHKELSAPFNGVKKIRYVQKEYLEKLTTSTSHQGYVAKVTEKPSLTVKEFLDTCGDDSLVLILDGIEDPQNMGALFRAAECFGVDAVIFSKNRSVSLTPVVSKASVGATEIMEVAIVSNVRDALLQLHDEGFTSFAAENEAGAILHSALPRQGRRVLIVGSEGKGVQPLLKKTAHHKVVIPLHGRINSLNVSQATAVLLAALR